MQEMPAQGKSSLEDVQQPEEKEACLPGCTRFNGDYKQDEM